MEEEELIRGLPEEHKASTSGSPLGKVMHTVLTCRPRHLSAAISRLGPSPSRSSSGALLDESLCFLWRQVEDAAKREEPMDQILVPMIEHFKEQRYSKQVLVLLRWLCGNELLHQPILRNLSEVITKKKDNFIAFGWCMLVRSLVEQYANQFCDEGHMQQHVMLLKILCKSIPRLLSIICEGSKLVDGFELPTRVAATAADCTLVLTQALANKAQTSGEAADSKSKNRLVELQTFSKCEKEHNDVHLIDLPEDLETESLLWSHLDELIILVEKLQLWCRKSLPLHEKVLKHILKWLQELKQDYVSVQDIKLQRSELLLLASCWKHYGLLIRFESSQSLDSIRQLLGSYLSALELYVDHDVDSDTQTFASSLETRKFFLNCIALLWGRLHGEQLATMVSEIGAKLVNVLLSQLKCSHHDLVEVTASIIRTIILRTDFLSGINAIEAHPFEAILQSLLSLLDERDSTAKVVVLLMAEFCYVDTDGRILEEMCKRLSCGTCCQKKNAIAVIVELLDGHPDSINVFPLIWQDIARCLLECLGDEELIDQAEASNLFPYFDPSIVLPQLIHLSCLINEKVHCSASNALVSVLKNHMGKFVVIEVLLDTLSALSENPNLSSNPVNQDKFVQHKSAQLLTGSKLDVDNVLRLTPKWMKNVENMGSLLDQLLEKMFLNPSNAVIVRFLSYLSDHLAEARDSVLKRVLSCMQGQNMDESWPLHGGHASLAKEEDMTRRSSLFDRLCPLLIIRIIPLKAFDDLECQVLYGDFHAHENLKEGYEHFLKQESIAAVLFNRAFGSLEYEDVRKLAAELCGRLHPRVLLPVVQYHLDCASRSRDTLKLKACLFSLCTSLVARGSVSMMHPSMTGIRAVIDFVLSWPSVNSDEVSKAQHGCIDCLALMACAEVQTSETSSSGHSILQEARGSRGSSNSSVLTCVIQRLTSNGKGFTTSVSDSCSHDEVNSPDEKLSKIDLSSDAPALLSFRLCMANVLISACQKVESSRRYILANKMIPPLTSSVESIADSCIRSACLQVLFSAVYHLKSSVLPYSFDLLKLSLKALKRGSDKEKIAAAKLLASLMASERDVVDSLSAGLLEARLALAGVLAANPSAELRQLCGKLLACITPPLDSVLV